MISKKKGQSAQKRRGSVEDEAASGRSSPAKGGAKALEASAASGGVDKGARAGGGGLGGAERYVAFCALSYAASGALQPTLVDWLRYHGGTGVSMLPMLANTLAMSCVAPIKELVLSRRRRATYAESAQWSWRRYVSGWFDVERGTKLRIGVVVVMDFAANFLVMVGLLFVGSGVYAVLFSSSIAFAALFSRVVGGKRFRALQWFGVGLVTLGMALNGAASMEDALARGAKALFKTEIGAATIISGSVLHSVMLVYAETAVSDDAVVSPGAAVAAPEMLGGGGGAPEDATLLDADPTTPHAPGSASPEDAIAAAAAAANSTRAPLTAFRLATYLGVVEAGVLVAHNLALVAHHGVDKLYLRSIRDHESTPSQVLSIYGCLFSADLVHALAHYALLESAGAVSIAISRGVQMVFVVAISATVFCDSDPGQCLTPVKVVSVTNVVAGIAFYARSSLAKTNTK